MHCGLRWNATCERSVLPHLSLCAPLASWWHRAEPLTLARLLTSYLCIRLKQSALESATWSSSALLVFSAWTPFPHFAGPHCAAFVEDVSLAHAQLAKRAQPLLLQLRHPLLQHQYVPWLHCGLVLLVFKWRMGQNDYACCSMMCLVVLQNPLLMPCSNCLDPSS